MPPLLVLAAVGVGAYVGVKWIRNKAAQINRDLERAKKNHDTEQDVPMQPATNFKKPDIAELEKDPITGIYRVKDD